MQKHNKIYIVGHRGFIGSAIKRYFLGKLLVKLGLSEAMSQELFDKKESA